MAGQSLATIFADKRPVLLRYLLARGAADEAEDIIQELWLKLPAVVDESVLDPLGYLYRMAHNLMLDRRRTALRRERRERVYFADVEPIDSDGATHEAPERVLIARERLGRIDRALAALGPKTDRIFRQHRVEGIAQRVIAEELGITVSAVEKHLQKAYRTVAQVQRDYLDEDGGSA